MAQTEIMASSHKTITHISTHNVPQISILGILNTAIRVCCRYTEAALVELPAIRGMALCVNSWRCQSSYLPPPPPPPDQKGPVLWCDGGVEGVEEGELRQETQGCWHVLFFHYVISIPMRSALIFDEPSAQHPPLSPSHPIPSHPSLFLSLPLFLLQAFLPIYVSLLSYMLHFFLLWCICLASWNLSIFVKVAERGWGIWDELGLIFFFSVPYLLLEAQQRLQSKSA